MLVETLFSPTTLLWLAVSAIAVATLFGSIHRRRSRLTDTLHDYVDRQQGVRKKIQPDREPLSDD
jgi:hypothetical protein